MPTKLTKTILRNAALIHLAANAAEYRTTGTELKGFMCSAIGDAARAAHPGSTPAAVDARAAISTQFSRLLQEHGVDTAGTLMFADAEGQTQYVDGAWGYSHEAQAHRHTFLLLLAESL